MTETPAAAQIALITARIAARIQKSQNGCGRALPTRSITPMARMIHGSLSLPVGVVVLVMGVTLRW